MRKRLKSKETITKFRIWVSKKRVGWGLLSGWGDKKTDVALRKQSKHLLPQNYPTFDDKENLLLNWVTNRFVFIIMGSKESYDAFAKGLPILGGIMTTTKETPLQKRMFVALQKWFLKKNIWIKKAGRVGQWDLHFADFRLLGCSPGFFDGKTVAVRKVWRIS